MWIKNTLLALFPVVILASTPLYFFYGVNYLPNVPAISFSFAGLYYMLQFRRNYSIRDIVISTFFFSLATLLKPTDGGIMWLAGTLVMLHESFVIKSDRKKILPILASSAVIAICVLAWGLFVIHYNEPNGVIARPQKIYPIWVMSYDNIKLTFFSKFQEWIWTVFQHRLLHFLWMTFAIVFIIKWKVLDPFLRKFILWLTFGSLAYAVLFFDNFYIHDYYMLFFTIPVVFTSISVIALYDNTIAPKLKKPLRLGVYMFLICLMIISIYHNQFVQLDKYRDENIGVQNPAIYEVEPYLRKIGITDADSVLSVPDYTPNISLAAFGNAGYSSEACASYFTPKYAKEHGIKYMIITDASYIHKPNFEPYTTKLLGEFKGIYIYDIR